MKNLIVYLVGALICVGVNTSVQAQKKSETFVTVTDAFKTSIESYETRFFTNFFELKKTGAEILSDSAILADVEKKLFDAFILEFNSFKTFSLENKGEKPFKYKYKKVRGFEEEQKEFVKQIGLLINDYKNNRLTWMKAELTKQQTMEMMRTYITPVVDKFKKKISNLQKKVKDL